jgi:hypothetical protein
MKAQISLPRFRQALKAHEKELQAGTYWRYRNGMLPPPLGHLLVNNPDLAQALADDARDLSKTKEDAA